MFSDHIDGALGATQEDELGAHLAECAPCREALREYEEALSSLAGTSPSPPPEMEAQILRALGAARPSEQRRAWSWRLVPALGTLAAGVALGVLIARNPVRERTETLPQCSAALPRSIALDLGAYTGVPDSPGGEIEVGAGPTTLRLPRRLTSRGPYRPDATLLVDTKGGACLPLRAAYGYNLLLSVVPLDRPASRPGPEMRIEADRARVFYRRVSWVSGGYSWTLEGRAGAAELLDLAQELVTRSSGSS